MLYKNNEEGKNMWYLNPKNLALIALLVVSVMASGLYLWQRNTVIKQKSEIGLLKVSNESLQGQIEDYKKNILAMKKAQKEQQQIANDTAQLLSDVNKMVESKCIGGKDEKSISDITYYFNSNGKLSSGSTEANGKAVSKADPSHISGWTTKQLVENYLVMIDYVLKLERSISCYESN